MRISACYIVKDEAAELRRSLDSIKDQADEIIVVQTVQSQEVHRIAEQAGARLFYFAWQDDFAAARNFALSRATGDWLVLILRRRQQAICAGWQKLTGRQRGCWFP